MGLGRPRHPPRPARPRAAAFLRDEVGVDAGGPAPPVALEHVRLADPALPDGAARPRWPRRRRRARARRPRSRASCTRPGKGYPDLVRQRAGDCTPAPDAVVCPRTHERGRRGARARAPSAGSPSSRSAAGRASSAAWSRCAASFAAVVALDLRRLDRQRRRRRRCAATLGPGLRGPAVERALERARASRSATSRRATSTRRSAAASPRARPGRRRRATGAIDEIVLGVALRRAARASSTLPARPASAAGPDLRELVVGSEGDARGDHRGGAARAPAPASAPLRGLVLRALRRRAPRRSARSSRSDVAPDVARLSDEAETAVARAGRHGGLKGASAPPTCALRG